MEASQALPIREKEMKEILNYMKGESTGFSNMVHLFTTTADKAKKLAENCQKKQRFDVDMLGRTDLQA